MDLYDGSTCQKMYQEECVKYMDGEIDYFPLYLIFNADGFQNSQRFPIFYVPFKSFAGSKLEWVSG
jgi:hypothetical protein